MGFGWFNTRINPIAVDVGTSVVKLLQLEPREEQCHLLAAAAADIPPEVRAKPAEREEFVAETLRKLIGQNGFRGRQIVTCLPARCVAMQHLRMAKMSPEELQKALPFEAQGKLPFDAGRAVLRHVVAGEVYHDSESKTEVILMAASRESVDRHLAVFSKARLEVVGMHVEPTALIECFAHLFRRKGDENISTMFVDLGAGATHVVISHGKHMVFAKHVAVGGETFDKKAAEILKGSGTSGRDGRIALTAQTAGGPARLPAGVVAIGTGNGHPLGANGQNGHAAAGGLDADTAARLLTALEEPIETLVSELQLCVRYYESVFPGKQVDRVIFVGGESRHVWMCQKVAQKLGLPATLGDPIARLTKADKTATVNLDLRQPQPGWAIAVGLGMGIKAE